MRSITHFLLLALLGLSLCTASACSWMGETAGRAKAGIENSLDNTKDGYNKGYKQGKNQQGESKPAATNSTSSQSQPAKAQEPKAPQSHTTTSAKTPGTSV